MKALASVVGVVVAAGSSLGGVGLDWTQVEGTLNLSGFGGALFSGGVGGSAQGGSLSPDGLDVGLGAAAAGSVAFSSIGASGSFASLQGASAVVDFTGVFSVLEDTEVVLAYDFTGLDPKNTAARVDLFDVSAGLSLIDVSLGFDEEPTSITLALTAGSVYSLDFAGTITGSSEGAGSVSLEVADPVVGIGDLDASGVVDLDDLLTVLGAFGDSDAGDANGDGATDLADLLLVLSVFGTSYAS